MRYRFNRGYRYRITNPPKALLKARLDNIAIVPASMLPLTEILKEKANTLPQGGVVLCYSAENTRQRELLERVGDKPCQNIVYLSAELNRLCRIRVSADISIRGLSPVGGNVCDYFSIPI